MSWAAPINPQHHRKPRRRAAHVYPLHFTGLWLCGGVLILGAIVYLSLATSGPVMHVGSYDKLWHLLAYTVLMSWFGGIFRRRAQWLLLLAFVGLGIGLEYLQAWGGVRMLSQMDMAMNALGLLLGKKLCRFGLEGWCQKVEEWLLAVGAGQSGARRKNKQQ